MREKGSCKNTLPEIVHLRGAQRAATFEKCPLLALPQTKMDWKGKMVLFSKGSGPMYPVKGTPTVSPCYSPTYCSPRPSKYPSNKSLDLRG